MIGRERFQNSRPYKTFPNNFSDFQRQIVRLSWTRLPFQVAADVAGAGRELPNRPLERALHSCRLFGQISQLAATA